MKKYKRRKYEIMGPVRPALDDDRLRRLHQQNINMILTAKQDKQVPPNEKHKHTTLLTNKQTNKQTKHSSSQIVMDTR